MSAHLCFAEERLVVARQPLQAGLAVLQRAAVVACRSEQRTFAESGTNIGMEQLVTGSENERTEFILTECAIGVNLSAAFVAVGHALDLHAHDGTGGSGWCTVATRTGDTATYFQCLRVVLDGIFQTLYPVLIRLS